MDATLREQIAAVEQASKAARAEAQRSHYPAERALIERRALALVAAADSLRYLGALRDRRRPRSAR
jgi:hypothetical protein